MLDNKYIFQGVLDYIKEKYDYVDMTMNLWFNPLELLELDMDGERVSLLIGNDWKRNNIIEKYMHVLIDGFKHELGWKMVDITFITKDELEKKEQKKAEEAKKPAPENNTDTKNNGLPDYTNDKYTFENFIVGESNRVAYETSKLICESPAEYYNPLFIYGPSGLGKTHLLFAIINAVKKKYPHFNVKYIPCEEFRNMLVDSITKKTDTTIFRSMFRNLDFLLVDDIQFLANRNAVQEEMFHTFETLYNKGKQVVFASDRHPSELENIDKRLTSRFSMGGLFDIAPPDTELRQAIFKHKAESYGVEVPNSVLEYLADNIKNNIRQIEGAIKTLKAHSLINGEDITLPMAKRVLSEYLRKAEVDSVNADKILKYISLRYGVKQEDITGPKRDAAVKNARHVCAFLMRSILNLTYKEIGVILNKHHSTIIESCDKIEDRRKNEEKFNREIAEIERDLSV